MPNLSKGPFCTCIVSFLMPLSFIAILLVIIYLRNKNLNHIIQIDAPMIHKCNNNQQLFSCASISIIVNNIGRLIHGIIEPKWQSICHLWLEFFKLNH
jgi:hypothetical protein